MKYVKLFEEYLNEPKRSIIDYGNSKNKIAVGLKTNLLKDMMVRYVYREAGDSIHFFNNKDKHFATLFDKGTRYQMLRHDGSVNDYGWLKENSSESGLKKVYLATRRDSGQRWWSYKGFAGDKFFIQVTENNIDKIEINPEYPILNYHSSIVEQLLKEGRIKEENIYNHPKWIPLSGSKKEFHKLVGEDENVPTTVYSKNEALKKLKFPIIAKPANGHSGIGIQVIKNPELMEDVDEKIFDTFSEYVDKMEEMRFFMFNGEPIFWMERTPVNDKAKSGDGDAKEEMHFNYKKRNIENIPIEYKKVLEKYCSIFEKFPYICFDMMKDKKGKVFVIESNSQPGVPFDSTVQIYKKIYEDFYGIKLDEDTNEKLNDYANQMIEKTLEKDNGRFSIEK